MCIDLGEVHKEIGRSANGNRMLSVQGNKSLIAQGNRIQKCIRIVEQGSRFSRKFMTIFNKY